MNAVTATRARAVSIPAWVWLGGIVVVSAIVRIALGRRIVAPWIMVDELVYSELAKSFAASGHFLVRGVPSHGYGFVYPVLLAPAYRLYTAVPDAYRLAKDINGVVMSLAAIPAYFLARRVLTPALSLVAAALAVLVPSMLYTGTLMTENAFYPLFLLCALVLVLVLERPTPLRQVVLLVLCGLAYATRAQAAALVPAIVCAPALLVLVERRGLRGLRAFVTLYGILAAGVVLALLATAARGRSPLSLLGAYRAATTSSYSAGNIARFFLYHVAELDLYVGIVPFAALLALWLAPRAVPPALRAFAVASLCLCFWLVVEVAAFASQPSVGKIEERNMFYVAPLFLVALLVARPPRARVLAAAAAVAAVLPVFIPYGRFINPSATADTFGLLPWWWVQDHGVLMADLRWVALGAGIVGAALYLWLPRRFALALPVAVGAYFVLTTFVVANGVHGIHQASLGKLWAGIRAAHPDWIDRSVGPHASVAVLRTQDTPDEVVWENEFFNRSVGPVSSYAAQRVPDPLPETVLARRGNDLVADGRTVHVRYVLAPTALNVVGKRLEADGDLGFALYRVDGPLAARATRITGLYPTDTWSHRTVTYSIDDCKGGTLAVSLQSDASLFKQTQVVTATDRGRFLAHVGIAPGATQTLTAPMHPRGGRCTVTFHVAHLANPALVEKGSTDNRLVGVHFLSFDYTP